jgi:excisionase family DNA binding protein
MGKVSDIARPFSPETLAERWACSPEKVRRMYHDGELVGFRLGKLIRIPAAEVERFECQSLTDSSATGDAIASPTMIRNEVAFESRLARMTAAPRKLALVNCGAPAQPRQPTR